CQRRRRQRDRPASTERDALASPSMRTPFVTKTVDGGLWFPSNQLEIMTRAKRDEFWRRFHIGIEQFREAGADCDVAVNAFENRQWDVKFSKRRAGDRMVSVSLAILEHAPSREQFLLAVTPT